jgi:transcriptional regulator with GAF, ATPase, and Fis domain
MDTFSYFFHRSPYALFDENISEIMETLENYKQQGVTDIKKYLQENPEVMQDFFSQIIINDFNFAAVKLLKAKSKKQLREEMIKTFTKENIQALKEILIALFYKRKVFSCETTKQTLQGKTIHILMNFSIPEYIQENYTHIFVSMVDITELKHTQKKLLEKQISLEKNEKQLKKKLKIENIISGISKRFIHITSEKIEKNILHALKQIGEFLKVDRSFIFQFHDSQPVMNNTYEWSSFNTPPQKDAFQYTPAHHFSSLLDTLEKNQAYHVPRILQLGEEAKSLQEMFLAVDTKSFLCVPLMIQKKCIGFLGVSSVKKYKRCDKDEIYFLQIIADIFTQTFERKKAEDKVFDSYKYLGIINRQIAVLLDMGKKYNSEEQSEIMQTILHSAQNLSQAKMTAIYTFNEQTSVFSLLTSTLDSVEKKKKMKTLSPKIIPFLQEISKYKKRIQIHDDNVHFYKLYFGKDIHYVIGLPLIHNKKLFGALFLGFDKKREITTQELDFFEVFALQSAYLLNN